MRAKAVFVSTAILFAALLSLLGQPTWAPTASGQTVPTRIKSPTAAPVTNTPTPLLSFLPFLSRFEPRVTIRALTVNLSSYVGACPGLFVFGAILSANAPTDAQYAWERSDGSMVGPQAIRFDGAGEQSVVDHWSIAASGVFWERLHIITPNQSAATQSVINVCY
jgi:hypothetical protein